MSEPQHMHLSSADPDTLEVAEGTVHDKIEGWIPDLATEAELREALEKAFDYRGDVTITRKDGIARGRLHLRSPQWQHAGRFGGARHPARLTREDFHPLL